ncbi:hypothetical protein IT399_02800 [Candidatus Nomurabacteria bacterium]|nr:hypothetical protein [Candidatus Nomurabacteria bacterium]
MKKFFYFFLVAIMFVATSAIGQPVTTSAPVPTYTIQPGDNLWVLSAEKLGNPRVWTSLVHKNPYLQEKGRIFSRGDKTVVLLKPGEKLVGLEELGLLPESLPISALQSPTTVSKPWPTPAPVVVEDTMGSKLHWLSEWLFWWILIPAIVAVLAFYLFGLFLSARDKRRERREEEQELSQDPVSSGPAVVPGGIEYTETARLESYFQDQASSQSHSINPPVRISPIEEGVISGSGMVGYADRARRRRINPAQPGYRARFRFSDGSERVLMSLQACMNPCTYGEGLSGFTFVPGRIAVPAPEPAPVSVTPTRVTPSSPTDHPEEGVVRFELRKATAGQPAMVRITGVDETGDNTVELRSNVLIFRYTPRS